MKLYGYVVEGKVWGIGYTKEWALADAEREFRQLMELEREGIVQASDAPKFTSEPTFEVIDSDTARRVANRDLSCVRTPDVWVKVAVNRIPGLGKVAS